MISQLQVKATTIFLINLWSSYQYEYLIHCKSEHSYSFLMIVYVHPVMVGIESRMVHKF
jgi:hypothetical protein